MRAKNRRILVTPPPLAPVVPWRGEFFGSAELIKRRERFFPVNVVLLLTVAVNCLSWLKVYYAGEPNKLGFYWVKD